MTEVELKFQVPVARRAALDAAVAGRARVGRVRLQAMYFDTADRALAAAGIALRLRREGRRWVQTLKGATADGMTRHEHNVPLGASAVPPVVDPTLHRGTPVGDALLCMLALGSGATLAMRYRTDILRRTRLLRLSDGRVELALDAGRIVAEGREVRVLELEFELSDGSPRAVLEAARQWVPRFGLWLDTRSKAERGDMLARAEPMAAPRGAASLRLTRDMNGSMAWQAVLRGCVEQVAVNASQISSGVHATEHVHQLRVGLRRLRSAVRLFTGEGVDAELGHSAALLFRRLGGARDQNVFEGALAADLRAALQSAGFADDLAWLSASGTELPVDILRDTTTQLFLLDLIGAVHGAGGEGEGEGEPDRALRAPLARRLARWDREVATEAARFAELDTAGRHRLRKRVKRLRYGAEFVSGLFANGSTRRYLRALDRVQMRLGVLNDLAVAMAALRRVGDADPRGVFASAWFATRRATLLRKARHDIKPFLTARRFWRKD